MVVTLSVTTDSIAPTSAVMNAAATASSSVAPTVSRTTAAPTSGAVILQPALTRLVAITGADSEMFERGGPEAIIYKILERGGPKSLKMAFECLFQ